MLCHILGQLTAKVIEAFLITLARKRDRNNVAPNRIQCKLQECCTERSASQSKDASVELTINGRIVEAHL